MFKLTPMFWPICVPVPKACASMVSDLSRADPMWVVRITRPATTRVLRRILKVLEPDVCAIVGISLSREHNLESWPEQRESTPNSSLADLAELTVWEKILCPDRGRVRRRWRRGGRGRLWILSLRRLAGRG